MNHILQHIPGCVDTGPPKTATFNSLQDLLNIPWVKSWGEKKDFRRFSQHRRRLIAEFREGEEWWVVGYLDQPVDELPLWTYR